MFGDCEKRKAKKGQKKFHSSFWAQDIITRDDFLGKVSLPVDLLVAGRTKMTSQHFASLPQSISGHLGQTEKGHGSIAERRG